MPACDSDFLFMNWMTHHFLDGLFNGMTLLSLPWDIHLYTVFSHALWERGKLSKREARDRRAQWCHSDLLRTDPFLLQHWEWLQAQELMAIDSICLCCTWQKLGKSNPVFPWFTEWVSCTWVSEVSAFVPRMSYFFPELPYIHNLISAVASGAPWSFTSCGVCGTWRPQGAIERRGEEGRMIWKQLSATVIVVLSWLFSKGGIILLWQKPQPIGTELLIDKQLYLSFAFAG